MLFSHRIFSCLLLLFGLTAVTARQCLGRDQCSCAFDDDQSMIALHSVANSDLTPRWKDLSSSDGNKYSFNPCYPFSEGNCAQAAACKTDSKGDSQNIGDSQTARFKFENNNLLLGYTSGSGIISVTTVRLLCEPHGCEPILTADGSTGPNSYQFSLTSVCACPNGCNETGPVNCLPVSAQPIHSSTILHIVISVAVSIWLGIKQ